MASYIVDHRMHEREQETKRQEERIEDLKALAALLGVKLGKG